ncbi:glyoxalase/bleomycin resistance protein/dioxygenase superfamily protein [Jatrophihabitans sp. GAS493]|uniref:VOC family protein n=1 Tax=Jatrophihabitans sp. GAS493 TaxID=1907575 RepID=UPI000BB8899F|nr:VOC family protein [Jatrophihabitans sp. GAS493]SOD71771.1 glyoxalase/bleomycin resistance protein/dioxygenase superfamily protein [Jatrophihabitans sp. GAS493]
MSDPAAGAAGWPKPAIPVHIGLAVADLDAAMAKFGPLLGLTWGEPVRGLWQEYLVAGSRVRWSLSYVKSTVGQPQIELLQGGPGSTWHTDASGALHHYAFATPRPAADRRRFLGLGWRLDLCRADADPDTSFAYLTRAGDVRVELVPIDSTPVQPVSQQGGRA